MDCFMASCTMANLTPARSSCTGSLFPQNCVFCLKYFIILEAVLPLIAVFMGLHFWYKQGQVVHIHSLSELELRIWWVVSDFLVYMAFFICRSYIVLECFKLKWSIFIEVIEMSNMILFHPHSFCFFFRLALQVLCRRKSCSWEWMLLTGQHNSTSKVRISRNYCRKVTMDVIKKIRQHSIWVYYEWSLWIFFKYFTAAKNVKERWLP